jgi:hypothetical protein
MVKINFELIEIIHNLPINKYSFSKMSYDINQKDIELLKNNPHQLILELQGLLDIIINQFIRSGKFNFTEHDEIKQQINEELLNRISKIQNQFQGKSLLRTYISVVIRNICNEIIRKRGNTNFVSYEEIIINKTSNETMNSLLFEEEMDRLKKALGFYYKQKSKLILCLKLKFKMPFEFIDFRNVIKDITQTEFEIFIHNINPYLNCPDIVIFAALTDIFNKYENKIIMPDTLRKWIKLKINELIDILNGSPPASKYDEETLQILFEKCYYIEGIAKVF